MRGDSTHGDAGAARHTPNGELDDAIMSKSPTKLTAVPPINLYLIYYRVAREILMLSRVPTARLSPRVLDRAVPYEPLHESRGSLPSWRLRAGVVGADGEPIVSERPPAKPENPAGVSISNPSQSRPSEGRHRTTPEGPTRPTCSSHARGVEPP